jgi:hypothetical protein
MIKNTNKRVLVTAIAISLYPIAVRGQEVIPKIETGISYSYLREGATPGYTGADLTKGFDASGVLNLNRWLGAELDTSHFWGNQPLIVPLPSGRTEGDSTFHTLMGGPRFTYRGNARVTPFAHILIGGAGIYSGYSVPPPSNPSPAPSNPSPVASGPGTPGYPGAPGAPSAPGTPGTPSTAGFEPATNMAFAWSVGGGLDVNVNDRIGLRLFQADYLNARTDGFSGKPVNNLRISTGLVLRFGSK